MERMLVSAAPHFTAQGIDSMVVGLGSEHPFAEELRRAGYDVSTLRTDKNSLRAARQIRDLLVEKQVDVVHIHPEANYLRNVLAARWAIGANGSIIRTVHSIFPARGKWWLSRFVQAAVADRFVYCVVAPSPDVQVYERRIGRATTLVMNWVDDRMFTLRAERAAQQRSVERRPVGLLLGNCGQVKNHSQAISASLAAGHDLIHVGDERDADEYEVRQLNSLDANGQLRARGPSTPDRALLEADYLMIPSIREGMSVALAEGLTVGLPAIVNDAPGLRWAASIPGVQVVSGEAQWSAEVSAISVGSSAGPVDYDFSAARGARDYARLYRRQLLAAEGTAS
ncbi:glycosyltransferase [Curtobacterium sp. MCBA15_012]|uniref:glycosyltransferase n=1 Tax=Curtobacterium sp. MCBA15_012 TaxID=1898738 RepID=UPI0011136033|nr:glycosyltransferase [Curtobacterium sp. MCBA15_012]WIB00732.1 glycosyltransferase [Curtobacterium sp. MCBA15_012]